MKKIKIGIPRALLYYRYYILWKTFFEKLGCTIVLSPETNKEIMTNGLNNTIDESCLSYKIYIGHVIYLIDKCDYLLVPRIVDYGKKEKVCVKFNGLYDIIKNKFPNLNILKYNIEQTKHHYQFFGFVTIGLKLKKPLLKIIYSYLIATNKQKAYNLSLINNQINVLKSKKKKILIVSHPYNIYDKLIGSFIIKYFKDNNIDLLYADRLDRKIAKEYAYDCSPTLYWTYSKELIGSINYYQNNIEGILFLTAFPCGSDSLVNELMIRKTTNIPKLNLIIDELTTDTGLETRLESFVDLINARGNND